MRNTIRNVTIVVPVLMTSCHVSEKWKIGPVTAHARMTATATENAQELPAHSVAASENFSRACPMRLFGSGAESPRALFAAFGRSAAACAALRFMALPPLLESATRVPCNHGRGALLAASVEVGGTTARYGRKAQQKVERAMHERKRGTLRSGRSGDRGTSRKQAIAIGLSEARRASGKVPSRRGASRHSSKRK